MSENNHDKNRKRFANTINLDMPQLDGTEGYIGVYFSTILSIAALLRDPEITKSPYRINYQVSLVISLIPDTKIRKDLRQKLKDINTEKLNEIAKDRNVPISALDYREKENAMVEASIETVGFVIEYVDKYIGISTQNKVGFTGVHDMLKEKELVVGGENNE